jgi:tetratricopeptide (TPR) repeat protein
MDGSKGSSEGRGANFDAIRLSGKDAIDRAMESGDPAIAEEAFREIDAQLKSTEAPRDRANILLRKAALYGVLGRFDDARKQMNIALQEAPNDSFTRMQFDFMSGEFYDDEGRPKEAYDHLTEALAKHVKELGDPELRVIYESTQVRRGFNLIRLDRHQEAVPILEEVLSFKLAPANRSVVLASLGECYLALKELEKARDCLEEASKIGLTSQSAGQVHYNLGIVYAFLGLLSESKREFQICEQHATEYGIYGFPVVKVYGWLSRICKGLGEMAESERYARLARPI